MNVLVIDSFAILAFLHKEESFEKVKTILGSASEGKIKLFLSIINLAEVYYKLLRSVTREKALLTINSLKEIPIEIVSARDDQVLKVAEIKAEYPIALGDCFAAALAMEKKAVIATGDREFKKVEKLVKIRWL